MLCARRGESCRQNETTLYPSSASDALADAPASPVPTTRIVNFRLFAGLMSFISKRWRSHLVSIGPSGTFASSLLAVASTVIPPRLPSLRASFQTPARRRRPLRPATADSYDWE